MLLADPAGGGVESELAGDEYRTSLNQEGRDHRGLGSQNP